MTDKHLLDNPIYAIIKEAEEYDIVVQSTVDRIRGDEGDEVLERLFDGTYRNRYREWARSMITNDIPSSGWTMGQIGTHIIKVTIGRWASMMAYQWPETPGQQDPHND